MYIPVRNVIRTRDIHVTSGPGKRTLSYNNYFCRVKKRKVKFSNRSAMTFQQSKNNTIKTAKILFIIYCSIYMVITSR